VVGCSSGLVIANFFYARWRTGEGSDSPGPHIKLAIVILGAPWTVTSGRGGSSGVLCCGARAARDRRGLSDLLGGILYIARKSVELSSEWSRFPLAVRTIRSDGRSQPHRHRRPPPGSIRAKNPRVRYWYRRCVVRALRSSRSLICRSWRQTFLWQRSRISGGARWTVLAIRSDGRGARAGWQHHRCHCHHGRKRPAEGYSAISRRIVVSRDHHRSRSSSTSLSSRLCGHSRLHLNQSHRQEGPPIERAYRDMAQRFRKFILGFILGFAV